MRKRSEKSMSKLKTRWKFLMVKLAVAVGLTVAVILIVRHSIAQQADKEMTADLQSCIERFTLYRGYSELAALTPGVPSEGLSIRKPLDRNWAKQTGAILGCEIAVIDDGKIVASSVDKNSEKPLGAGLRKFQSGVLVNFSIGKEDFQAVVLPFEAATDSPQLLLLKSWARVREKQASLTRLLAFLAAGAMVFGFLLVLRISDTFGQPLRNLVGAVHALEKGDYDYPVAAHTEDELEEVTQAFEQMRISLKESQNRLIQSERMATIGKMASSISHDLRHSLTAIVANAEFLSDERLGEGQRNLLYQEIRVAVDQMNDLVESLLEFSRGRETPRLVNVHLEDVVDRAIRSVKLRPEFHRIEFTVNGSLPLECKVDPLKIERALLNLLSNAGQAVDDDSGRVELSWEKMNGALRIRVEDNGQGVPAEIRDRLFEPFVSHAKVAGTGLGLAIVQKISEEHGGRAILETSEPGRTVFCMILPQQD
jgi:signal transduction histidine kinase